ncbi:MAG: hypothetical protein ACE5FU_07390, partial [Nitrospinota bacterium]
MFSSKNSLNYVSILLIIHHKKPLEIEFLGFATFAGLFYAKLGYGYVLFSEKKSHQMDQKELYATLEKNISKLQRCNKKLSVLLEQESLRPEIWDLVPTHDGNYTCRIVHENGSRLVNSAYKPWDEAGKDLLRFFIGRDARYVYYFGMGLGYHLKLLLERLPPG